MTFYQELQLNQAGSKQLIKSTEDKREKARHIAIYLFKVLISVAFCIAFVTGFSIVFGSENSIAGVVFLLCILAFRFSDLGIKAQDAMKIFPMVFAILAFAPRLANHIGDIGGFFINMASILTLLVFACHNIIFFNHSTLVLSYLLLYGYDVTGRTYLYRLLGLALAAGITMIVYYRNHCRKIYKRDIKILLREFDIESSRTRWQIRMAFGVAAVILLTGLLNFPRPMWAGIAFMSVTLPFKKDIAKRVNGRIPGNIIGCGIFFVIYTFLPESMRSLIGVISGIGVGLSATYQWQTIFNSLGALSIAASVFGLPTAIIFRIVNNLIGALSGLILDKLAYAVRSKSSAAQEA